MKDENRVEVPCPMSINALKPLKTNSSNNADVHVDNSDNDDNDNDNKCVVAQWTLRLLLSVLFVVN